jgi:hypothetical protein
LFISLFKRIRHHNKCKAETKYISNDGGLIMNSPLGTFISAIKTNKYVLWIVVTLLTLMMMVGPVLAEGATGSSV